MLGVVVLEALGERLTLPHSEMREEPDGDIVELDDARALRDPDVEAVSVTKVVPVREAPSEIETVADALAVIVKVSMVVDVADPAEERLEDTVARAVRVPTATDVVARPDAEPDPEIEGLREGLDDARGLALFLGVRLSLRLGVDVEDTKGDCDVESEPLSVRVPSAIVADIETVRCEVALPLISTVDVTDGCRVAVLSSAEADNVGVENEVSVTERDVKGDTEGVDESDDVADSVALFEKLVDEVGDKVD